MSSIKRFVMAASCGLLAMAGITASAHISGQVFCIDNFGNHIGLPGVTVMASGPCATSPGPTVLTDNTGHYVFTSWSVDTSGDCQVCVDTTTLPSTCVAVSGNCVTILPANVSGSEAGGIDFSYTGCCAPPPCVTCVDVTLGLGAAAGTSVLELGAATVSITGPAGGIIGDISIAPGGKLQMSGSEFITGTVRLGVGATFQNSSHSTATVETGVDLSSQINAALSAASTDAGLHCDQNLGNLSGGETITGARGLNVICVDNVVLAGKQILITGFSDSKFIINVSGKFVLTGGGAGPQIRVDTSVGLTPSDVLYNIIGTGPAVAFSGGGGGTDCCKAIVDGTILAPERKIQLSPGLVNGEIISGLDISIVSGSSVRCPPCP